MLLINQVHVEIHRYRPNPTTCFAGLQDPIPKGFCEATGLTLRTYRSLLKE